MSNRRAQGFALIDVVFVIGMIGILCTMALPRLLLAKQAASAASAISSMRAVNSAELTYALTCGSGFYAPNLSTLGQPPPGSNEAFITAELGTADTVNKSGYTIQLSGTPYANAPATCNGLGPGSAAQAFRAAADALEPTNIRFFATNSNSVIYEFTASLYAVMPESGEPPSGAPIH